MTSEPRGSVRWVWLPRLGQSCRPRSPIRSRNETHVGSRNSSLRRDRRSARRRDGTWLRSYARHGPYGAGESGWPTHRNMERDSQRFDRWKRPPRTNPDRRERTPERRTLEGQLDMSWQLDARKRLRRFSPLSPPSGCGRLLYRGRYRLPLAYRCQRVRLGHPASGRLCAKRHPTPRPERVDLTPVAPRAPGDGPWPGPVFRNDA
jgi:hypothetical protein